MGICGLRIEEPSQGQPDLGNCSGAAELQEWLSVQVVWVHA